MIKILHTADWHLGKKLLGIDRETEQTTVLQHIITQANLINPDIIIIAGDIFDSVNPPANSEKIYYKTLQQLSKTTRLIIIIAGNHDNATRLSSIQPLCEKDAIIILNDPYQIIEPKKYGQITITSSTPGTFSLTLNNQKILINTLVYPTEKNLNIDLETYENDTFSKAVSNILHKRHTTDPEILTITIAHLFLKSAVKTSDQNIEMLGGALAVNIQDLPKSNYIALGHIHKPVIYPKYNAAYSGSLLEYRDTEAKFDKAILEIELTLEKTTITKHLLPNPKPIKIINHTDIQNAINDITQKIDQEIWIYLNLKLTSPITTMQLKELKQNQNLLSINIDIQQPDSPHTTNTNLTIEEQFLQLFQDTHNHTPTTKQLIILEQCLKELNETT